MENQRGSKEKIRLSRQIEANMVLIRLLEDNLHEDASLLTVARSPAFEQMIRQRMAEEAASISALHGQICKFRATISGLASGAIGC